MPIGGFVITIDLQHKEEIIDAFERFPQVDVHGVDDQGNSVVVIDSETSEEMEQITNQLQGIDGVLSLGVTYFHAEDEVEKIESGELKPNFSFGRKGEKQADCA